MLSFSNSSRVTLALVLDWNDGALHDQYMEGLSDEMLDELTQVERPATLESLIILCL